MPSPPPIGSFSESLLYSTIRIETVYLDGATGNGTGFIFEAAIPKADRIARVLITNRHVVEGSVKGVFQLHVAKSLSEFAPSGQVSTIVIGDASNPFGAQWKCHPDPTIDLCAFHFSEMTQFVRNKGEQVFFQSIDKGFIYSDEELAKLTALEDVIMVGYPIGLYDSANNFPLIRSGATASHPAIDFCGKAEGVVDMACFPGSSGSPIYLYNTTVHYDKTRRASVLASRQALLGVLYAGPQWNSQGEMRIEQIPTQVIQKQVPVTPTMTHLGYYIKAREVLNMVKHLVPEADI